VDVDADEKPRREIGMFPERAACFLDVSPGTRLSSSCLPLSLETSLSGSYKLQVIHSPQLPAACWTCVPLEGTFIGSNSWHGVLEMSVVCTLHNI
jgi:hypothetical protein